MPGSHASRRTLVTGGAGFIGSHLVEMLCAQGERVTVVDNLSTGRRENLERVPSDALELLVGDVSSVLPTLDPGQFAAVYHLAAAVGVRLVIEQPIHTIETNVLETSAVLSFAAAASLPTLVASTSEVYGKGVRTPFAEDDDVLYGPTIFSRWSYACSKAIDEYLALAYHAERGLPATIVRFFNTVGPRQVGDYGMVLPRRLQVEFSSVVQQLADSTGAEVRASDIWRLFSAEYLESEAPLGYREHHLFEQGSQQGIALTVDVDGVRRTLRGIGNGPIDAAVHALGADVDVLDYEERAIGHGSDARAVAFVELAAPGLTGSCFGVGMDGNIVTASVRAILSAVNRVARRRTGGIVFAGSVLHSV